MDAKEFLLCPMEPNDSGYATVGGYLTALLATLFWEGEGFSGKRPFGNGGWESDVARAWVRKGLLPGEITHDKWGDEDVEYNDTDFLSTLRNVLKVALFVVEAD